MELLQLEVNAKFAKLTSACRDNTHVSYKPAKCLVNVVVTHSRLVSTSIKHDGREASAGRQAFACLGHPRKLYRRLWHVGTPCAAALEEHHTPATSSGGLLPTACRRTTPNPYLTLHPGAYFQRLVPCTTSVSWQTVTQYGRCTQLSWSGNITMC